MTAGFKRDGHDYTIPLCPYHHRGIIPMPYTKKDMEDAGLGPPGPPDARSWKDFHGSDRELLKQVSELLGACY